MPLPCESNISELLVQREGWNSSIFLALLIILLSSLHCRSDLAKPASTLYMHNLTGVLETAIRATNAQYADPEIIERLDCRLLEVCAYTVQDCRQVLIYLCTLNKFSTYSIMTSVTYKGTCTYSNLMLGLSRFLLGMLVGMFLAWIIMSMGQLVP